jgi:hypothetical protein
MGIIMNFIGIILVVSLLHAQERFIDVQTTPAGYYKKN